MGGKKSAITNNVRDWRSEAGLSQAKLADSVGVTRQTIIAMEQGRYAPSLELAFRLAHVFDAQIEELFQFDGSTL